MLLHILISMGSISFFWKNSGVTTVNSSRSQGSQHWLDESLITKGLIKGFEVYENFELKYNSRAVSPHTIYKFFFKHYWLSLIIINIWMLTVPFIIYWQNNSGCWQSLVSCTHDNKELRFPSFAGNQIDAVSDVSAKQTDCYKFYHENSIFKTQLA